MTLPLSGDRVGPFSSELNGLLAYQQIRKTFIDEIASSPDEVLAFVQGVVGDELARRAVSAQAAA